MLEKILFVDDEPNVLSALKRQLRGEYAVDTAGGGKEGLALMKTRGPYAVVVSDLRMPGMDGIDFLMCVKKMAPDTVRIMLSGNADMAGAVNAINRGSIFQFLLKPCNKMMMLNTLDQAIRQYRLLALEKELLDKTLKGSIKVLSEVLSLVNPEAFGRSSRIRRHISEMLQKLGKENAWEIETAALLSQVGCVILPEAVINKIYHGKALDEEERQLYNMHPMVGHDLLGHIPRMDKIARIIQYQEKHYDGGGIPLDPARGNELPLGSRILKVVLDFDVLETRGFTARTALDEMQNRTGRYDPGLLKLLAEVLHLKEKFASHTVSFKDLRPGMVLREDLSSRDDVLLLPRGVEINTVILKRLFAYARNNPIRDTVSVYIPKRAAL